MRENIYFMTQDHELPFTNRWFPLGTLVSSTNKTDRHDITEI